MRWALESRMGVCIHETDVQRMMANPCIYLLDLDPTIRNIQHDVSANTKLEKGREDRPK